MSMTTSVSERTSSDVRRRLADPKSRQPAGRSVYAQRSQNASRLRVIERSLSALPALALALLIVVIWYVSTTLGHVNPLFLPAPADVVSSLLDGLSTGTYLSNILVTVQESVSGFLLALLIALPLGYGLAKSRLLAAALHPYLAAGPAIPA